MNKKNSKVPKIKIETVDFNNFTIDQLVVDPYWEDLYNPPPKIDKLNQLKLYIK